MNERKTKAGDDAIRGTEIRLLLPRAIQDQELVLVHDGFRIAYLFAPAAEIVNRLHLLSGPVLGFWAVTVCSFTVYSLAIWIVLSAWVWLRPRRFRY